MKIADTARFEIRSLVLSFIVMAVCEAFFLIDVLADVLRIDINTSWFEHEHIEVFSVIALAVALIVIGRQIVHLLKEHRQAKASVQVASGELIKVINTHFDEWNLSASERDVAMLLIKGMSTQEIADLRDTKTGTVKSQSSAVYQKANVRGRNELVAFFVEDLLAGQQIIQ